MKPGKGFELESLRPGAPVEALIDDVLWIFEEAIAHQGQRSDDPEYEEIVRQMNRLATLMIDRLREGGACAMKPEHSSLWIEFATAALGGLSFGDMVGNETTRISGNVAIVADAMVAEWCRRFEAEEEPARTLDGTINNCALACGDLESNCQVCRGRCPDRKLPRKR